MNRDTILGLLRHILTAAGGGLVAKGAVDESAMMDIVGGVILIAGAVWSIIDKRSRASKVSTGGLTPGSASLLLLFASLAFVGCQTTNTAGRALATASMTAKEAVKGWLIYVETSGQVAPEQEAQVEVAYERFLIAKHIAVSAYSAAVKAGDLSVYDRALDGLNQSKADLLRLIDELSKPKPKPQAYTPIPMPLPGWQTTEIPSWWPLHDKDAIRFHQDMSRCEDPNCKESIHTAIIPL